MRASRLISLLMVLQARGCVSAEALASEFEVSVRTIYRDVDELSASGVPVYAERGPGGGFLLQEGYRTRLTGLTPDEAGALLLVGLPGPAAELGLGSAAASAERKMLAALPAGQAAQALAARRRILLDPLKWYQRAERPPFLLVAADAVWGQTRIKISYSGWKADTTRTLEPYGLVIKSGMWYLVAKVKQDIRTYRVSQIQELTRLTESFQVPDSFDLAQYWSDQLARFEHELQRGTATIRFSAGAMCKIERLGNSAVEAVRACLADVDGARTAQIPIEGIEHTAYELLSFGPAIQVLEPDTLVQRMRELAEEIASLYAARD
jgi:predicted DNA-binding transcriptional regulator YafY